MANLYAKKLGNLLGVEQRFQLTVACLFLKL
jgi:hypothetical protein